MNQGENLSNSQKLQLTQEMNSMRLKSEKHWVREIDWGIHSLHCYTHVDNDQPTDIRLSRNLVKQPLHCQTTVGGWERCSSNPFITSLVLPEGRVYFRTQLALYQWADLFHFWFMSEGNSFLPALPQHLTPADTKGKPWVSLHGWNWAFQENERERKRDKKDRE